jgi:uncharacterized repeat protein (TIGR02543 family)
MRIGKLLIKIAIILTSSLGFGVWVFYAGIYIITMPQYVTISYVNTDTLEVSEVEHQRGTVIRDFPSLAKEGYTFLGWYLNQDDELTFNRNTLIDEDLTLYGLFTINYFNCSFYDGSVLLSQQAIAYLGLVEDYIPQKAGYTFLGWSIDKNQGSTLYDFSAPMTHDIVLYAIWEIQSFEITFIVNGESNTVSYPFGSVIEIEDPEVLGYIFAGWSTSPDGFVEAIPIVTSNATYYAIFEKALHIEINYNGVIPNRIGYYDQDAVVSGLPSIGSTPGYTLIGYFYSNDLLSPVSFPFILDGNITIYALFNLIEYSITYELCARSYFYSTPIDGNVEPINNPQNQTIFTVINEVVLLDPFKGDYIFDGWYLNDKYTGSRVEAISVGTTHNITLYAKWIYELYFNNRHGNDEGNDHFTLMKTYGIPIVIPASFIPIFEPEDIPTDYYTQLAPFLAFLANVSLTQAQMDYLYIYFTPFDYWENGEYIYKSGQTIRIDFDDLLLNEVEVHYRAGFQSAYKTIFNFLSVTEADILNILAGMPEGWPDGYFDPPIITESSNKNYYYFKKENKGELYE